jgi:post-segregation antitoxin (ccd killing protein)
MAKAKDGVNKSKAIRAVIADQPSASVRDVVATLKAKGIDVSENLVYGVKAKLTPTAKKAPKATGKTAAPAPAAASFSKKSVNKSEEIRALFTATPTAAAKDVVATLKAKGIDVSENYVYGVKKTLTPKKKNAPKAIVTATAPITAATPSSNGKLGIGASIAVARVAAEKIGGWDALKEIVDAMV